MCSVKCVINKYCIGIDICDGKICCLWNVIIFLSNLFNNFNKFCK